MTDSTLDAEAQRLIARLPALVQSKPASLVTVFAVRGSTPRSPGARLLCRGGALIAGTIGGGRLEERAIACAHDLEQAPDGTAGTLVRYDLGPELAQCCGGVVEVLIERIDPAGAADRAAALVRAHTDGSPLVLRADGRELLERVTVGWTVVVFGAGHVGTALATVLAPLPWRVVVVDNRRVWADKTRFMAATEVWAEPPMALLAAWGWLGDAARASVSEFGGSDALATCLPPLAARSMAVVMTHDHGLDRDLCDVLLRVGAATSGTGLPWSGVIGSKTKIALLRRRLLDRGHDEEALARLVAPIGARIDGKLLGGKLPGEIAVAVAAQLLAVASGQAAGPAQLTA